MIPVDVNHFIVLRTEWSRGKGKITKLLDESYKKDCIGFLMLASGFKKEQILNLDEPIDIIRKSEWITKLVEWSGSTCCQTSVCSDIIKINDDISLDDDLREQSLINLFKKIDITLEFVN